MTIQVLVIHLSGPIAGVEEGLHRQDCSCTVLSMPASTTRSPLVHLEQMPDVVMLCAQHCGEELPVWVKSLRSRFPKAPLLYVGASDDASLKASVRAGLVGHLAPTDCDTLLGRALDAVSAGEAWLPRRLVSDIVHHWRRHISPMPMRDRTTSARTH